MDEKPGDKVLQSALRIAKAKFPDVRGENAGGWTDLARLLSHQEATITPQQIWNWRNRDGVPADAILLMVDRLGCRLGELIGHELPEEQSGEAEMTQEEKMLVDLYRRAGYNKRLALFTLLSAEGGDQPAHAKPKPPRNPKSKRP